MVKVHVDHFRNSFPGRVIGIGEIRDIHRFHRQITPKEKAQVEQVVLQFVQASKAGQQRPCARYQAKGDQDDLWGGRFCFHLGVS